MSFKLRYDGITGVLVLLEDRVVPALQNKIDIVREGYNKVDDGILKARNSIAFDDFRHPEFPDDVLLFFLKEGLRPEGIWCRIEAEIDERPAAILLSEPNGDFSVPRMSFFQF